MIITLTLQCMIMWAINDKREDGEGITGLAYVFGGVFFISKTESLYSQYYPSGKLVRLCWIFRALTIAFLVASVYFYGHSFGQMAQ